MDSPHHAADAAAPRFTLLDDADGRFVVDAELGVISLADESVLAREAGAVHTAKLRVVEHSGASYELELKLKLTGPVPQVADADDFLLSVAGVAA